MQADDMTGETPVSMMTAKKKSGANSFRLPIIPIYQVLLLFALLCLWELAVDFALIKEVFVSKPSAIFGALVKDTLEGHVLIDLAITVYETLLGFIISSVFGILAGIGLNQSPTVNSVLRPFITAVNNLPRLALAPLFVLWFGLGTTSRVALIISLVFFVVMLNTLAGLQNANRDHLLLAKTLGATPRQQFEKFVLPSAIPTIFAGLQIGLTYSFLTAVVGEMLTGALGLGARLQITLTTYQTDKFFAALILLAIVATVMSGAMRAIERRMLHWRSFEMRGLS